MAFASVCVNPYWVPLVAQQLAGSPVKVCSVVGFPLGASATSSKVGETQIAVKDGAHEIDMVINIGELRAGNHRVVEDDIRAVVSSAHATGAIVKVILEMCLLDEPQKIAAPLRAGEECQQISSRHPLASARVAPQSRTSRWCAGLSVRRWG